ncbi:MAG: GNAT family N-acetyltransferase [Gaiellaceae bacterium]
MVRRLSDPVEFIAAAGALLLADEARHNLILGLAGTLRDRPGFYEEFRLWVAEDDGRAVAAALQTPPYNLVLARSTGDEALEALADEIAGDGIGLPGVVAALPEADRFADAWKRRQGTTRRLRRAQRIYRVRRVRPPEGVPGAARVATQEDWPLLVDWVSAFAKEAHGDTPAPGDDDPGRHVDARLRDQNGGFLLWEESGAPVSIAGWGGPTPNGMRVGPVYTPPERRSRGYGSAVTAALSEQQLAAGRSFCFLYTDLANPTSNKIYVDIGYEPVCDSVDYAFAP